jgi:AcrR family transcriptional regulator
MTRKPAGKPRSETKPRIEEPGESPVRRRIIEAAFAAFMERGFAETSTLEIATRARASKRELYAHFDSKQDILLACIAARAKHLKLPADLSDPCDRDALAQTLTAFGTRLLRETTDPTVVAVFRLAIAEALRAPEVARLLNSIGIEASRAALRDVMSRACSAGLLTGDPAEMAEQFAGLLWGNQMIRLLLRLGEQPGPREIARRAEAATRALFQLYVANDQN